MKRVNQGTKTDEALRLARKITAEIEALIVGMYEDGQTLAGYNRLLDLLTELDQIEGELDLSCELIGMLSPWSPQVRDGEPTLAQLAGELVPFTPANDPELWTWPSLRASLDFLSEQEILSTSEWNSRVRDAETKASQQPIRIRLESQVEQFRQHLREGLGAGDSVEQFKKRVKPTIESTDATIERNFRTSSKRAYLDGVDKVTNKKTFPFVKYVATKDNRTRASHRVMDGRILEVGTPEYDHAVELQREYNCLLPGNRIEGEFLAGVRSHYSGKAVEVVTKSGSVLRVTVNHPVLTEHGFVAASSLKEGDKLFKHERHREVVSDGLSALPLSGRATEVDHEPLTVEEVFDALAALGHHEHTRAVTGDLHGDAIPDGEIDVVWSDARLLGDHETGSPQGDGNVVLELPLPRGVSGLDLGSTSTIIHPAPLHTLRVGLTSKFDTVLRESQVDGGTRGAEPLGKGIGRLTGEVEGDDFADREFSPSASGRALQARHPTADGLDVASKLLGDLMNRESAVVCVDEVLSVTEIQYSGHAYDFQSVNGLLLTHSIALGNCRCTLIPLTDKQAEREGVKHPEFNIEFDKAEEGKVVSNSYVGRVTSHKGVIYKIAKDEAISQEEVRLQEIASRRGLAPKVYRTEEKDGTVSKVAMENVRKTAAANLERTTGGGGVDHGTKPLQSLLDLNEEGIAHRDLHGGNVRWQPATGKAVFFDFEKATLDRNQAEWEAGQTLRGFIDYQRNRDLTTEQEQALDRLEPLIRDEVDNEGHTAWRLSTVDIPRAKELLEAWNR